MMTTDQTPQPQSPTPQAVTLKRSHAQRMRQVYRSAGWPYQDGVEIDLLAAGLLERVTTDSGHVLVQLTEAGIGHLADATQGNRQARSAHETLVDKVVASVLREGRIAWTKLSLRAKVTGAPHLEQLGSLGHPGQISQDLILGVNPDSTSAENTNDGHWKLCEPDVFSIRNSSRQDYLEPVVHEIKVSRADLLGALKRPEKRAAYLDVGGQCWYVLGCDRSGHPIAKPNEIPVECGVMVFQNNQFEVTRMAPKRAVSQLPFWVWMELAKATPRSRSELEDTQGALGLG